MRLPDETSKWYIEARPQTRSEKISLDLSRHLHCRSAVGPVLIVTNRPNILLSVIRKRWIYIIKEFDKQLSSTLEPLKKQSLIREISRLKKLQFSVGDATDPCVPDIVICKPTEVLLDARFRTVYIVIKLTSTELANTLLHVTPSGLLVVYEHWREAYEDAVAIANMAVRM